MEALVLTRYGIALTFVGALLISPEVISRAREIGWVDRMFVKAKTVLLRLESQLRFPVWLVSNPDTRDEIKTALEKGTLTKHLWAMTITYLTVTVSVYFSVMLMLGFISIEDLLISWPSVWSIISLLIAIITMFWLIQSIRIAYLSYRMAVKQHIQENPRKWKLFRIYLIFVPIIFYLGSAINGLLWSISDIAIILRSRRRRAVVAITGFALLLVGQGLQFAATFQ